MVASHRRAFFAHAASIVLFAALGCSSKGSGNKPETKHAGTPDDPFRVGLSQCNLGEPWRVQMNTDIQRALAPLPNVKLLVKDAQNDSLRQRAQVEELVNQGIDVLLISPKETAPLTAPVAEAYRKGIPVVVLDRAVEGEEYSVFIGADNRGIGREAGRQIGRLLKGKGNIVELKGLMTSKPAQDRHAGFLEGLDLAAHPDIHIVFEADMAWLEPNARREMASALAANKQIDLVYAHNDPGAHGAYLAAKEAGREKEMKFVGIDGLPHEGVQYVKQGILSTTFLYPTGGAEAVEAAMKLLNGQKVEKKITLGTRVYTPENVAQGGFEIK